MHMTYLKLEKKPMLAKRMKPLVLLTVLLLFSFQFPSLGSQSEDDDPNPSSSVGRRAVKRLKTMLEDDKEKLKPAKDKEEENIYANDEDVELIRGKLSKSKKCPPDNYFWKVFFRDTSAGKVSINLMDESPLGKHASIQIFLNKGAQGKHIGRIAYAKACNLSHYDVVYASMRRNNIASFKSAQAAGFREMKNKQHMQRVMKWMRFR